MNSMLVILLLASVSCVAMASSPGSLAMPKTCEDLLTQERCDQLRSIAAAVKAKTVEVQVAVNQAVANGAQTANEIYAKAVDFFRNRVLKLTCQDVLPAERCDQLRNIGTLVKAKAVEVNEAVRSAVLRGYQSGLDLYAKSVDFYRNRLMKLTCSDLLPAEKCARIEGFRVAVKAKATDVQVAISEAVAKGYQSAVELYANIEDFFKNRLQSMTCVDLLSPEKCNQLSVVAVNLKGAMDQAEDRIRAAILAGKTRASELYDTAVEYFKNNVANKNCEDLLSLDQCTQLRQFAASLKLQAGEFRQHVVDGLSTGMQTTVDAFETVKHYLKTQVTCESLLSNTTCSSIRSLASRVGTTISEVDRIIRESVVKGITTVSELYKSLIAKLTAKIFGDASSRMRRGTSPSLTEMFNKLKTLVGAKLQKVKDLLKQAVQETLDAYKIADLQVRAIIEQAILEGKHRAATLQQAVKDMLKNLVTGTSSSATASNAIARYRRDLSTDMTQVLSKVRVVMKSLLEKLLAKSNAALSRARVFIEDALKKVNGGVTRRDADGDIEQLKAIVDQEARAQLRAIADEAEARAETAVMDTVVESERDLDEITSILGHTIQRRDLMESLAVFKVELIIRLLNAIPGDTGAAAKKLVENNKAEIIAAYKKGFAALVSVVTGLIQG